MIRVWVLITMEAIRNVQIYSFNALHMVHLHFGPSHDFNKDFNLSISVHDLTSLGNKFHI